MRDIRIKEVGESVSHKRMYDCNQGTESHGATSYDKVPFRTIAR